MSDAEVERARARGAADLAARQIDTPVFQGATVTQSVYADGSGIVVVHIDGDDPTQQTPAVYVGPWSPYVGQRCVVVMSGNTFLCLGSTGAPVSRTWTPVITGFALGNGTVQGTYTRVDNLVAIEARITFASTSTYGAQLNIGGLPLPVTTVLGSASAGMALFAQVGAGTAQYPLWWRVAGGATSGPVQYGANLGAGANFWGATAAGNPNTWQSTNFIEINASYLTGS